MTTLYVVRHCEARGNADRVFQGTTDAEISENGKEQLKRLSNRFKMIRIDGIFSSPLKRALKTADAVNHHLGLPVFCEAGLQEINGGHWENKPWAVFPEIYPAEARHWNVEPWNFAPVNGETMRDVYRRISTTVMEIVEKNAGRTVAVVSHGCAIRNLLCFFKGYPIERLNDVEWSDNTAVSKIEFDTSLTPKIIFENDSSHLSQDVSTFAKQDWWKKENRRKIMFE